MSPQIVRRRVLLGGAVSAFAFTPSRTAQADTTFANFKFAATGAPTARTMPDRLAEVINVLDWGAVGDSATDDNAAIQSAINEAIRRGGGRVVFPHGGYKITNPGYLTVGSSNPDIRVDLVGLGGYRTVRLIFATTTGAAISRRAQTYDNLGTLEGFVITVANGSDGIKLEGTSQRIVDLTLESVVDGHCGIDASAATNAMIANCKGDTTRTRNANEGGPVAGTVGMYLGDGCIAYNCRLQFGFDIVFALSGICPAVVGTSMEVHRIGIRVGWGPAGETTAYGFSLIGCQFEACDVPIELYNCQSGLISGLYMQGQVAHTNSAAIQNITWSSSGGGTATVTTTLNHNIPAGNWVLQLRGLGGAFMPSYTGATQPGWILATVGGVPNQFTYYLPSDPGAYPGGALWNYSQPFAMRFRKVEGVAITGVGTGMNCAIATFDFDYDGQAQNHRNNVLYNAAVNNGIYLPQSSNPHRHSILAGWNFYGCSGLVNMMDGFGWRGNLTVASPSGHMVFADLPGQTGVYQDGPFQGQEFDITDSTLANTAANFAAATAGGGSNAVRVRWNGANWTISG